MTTPADLVSRLRRAVAEPGLDTYTDLDLEEVLERHDGDLHAAAAEVWEEKAAAVACAFDSSIDGVSLEVSQRHEHYLAMARRHRARSRVKSVAMKSRHEGECP